MNSFNSPYHIFKILQILNFLFFFFRYLIQSNRYHFSFDFIRISETSVTKCHHLFLHEDRKWSWRVFVSRVVASRYFYCLFTVYLYTCASISGTKIFLDGFVKSEPMQPTSLPSAIWSAWLRLIGDTSRTTTVHFHCHRKIWHDLSKSLLRFWHGSV